MASRLTADSRVVTLTVLGLVLLRNDAMLRAPDLAVDENEAKKRRFCQDFSGAVAGLQPAEAGRGR